MKVLLFWHKIPSGKQSLPVPSLGFLPQSLGLISSRPVACGDLVPSSLNLGLNTLVRGRKRLAIALKNCPSATSGLCRVSKSPRATDATGIFNCIISKLLDFVTLNWMTLCERLAKFSRVPSLLSTWFFKIRST